VSYELLQTINSPQDLKNLSRPQLTSLADELRQYVIEVVERVGGHLAPTLGVIELTIALHYLYDTPLDKIVWDVGHQAYAHKVLTGRREQLQTIRQKGGLAPFCKPSESEYDAFGAGHASTSISAALGMAAARDLKKEDYRVVAVIGDGSITGGLAYEGLNNLGAMRRQMTIVLNDNEMSISKTVGALSRHFSSIRTGQFYTKNRERVQAIIRKLPLGKKVNNLAENVAHRVVQSVTPGHFFEELGIQYSGPFDGHSIEELEREFQKSSNIEGPILVHCVTTKGHGYLPAKNDPEAFHGASPFFIHDGSSRIHRRKIVDRIVRRFSIRADSLSFD